MNTKHIGFLHPGAMGVSLAATVQNTGHTAYWVSEDRSKNTCDRAEKYSLATVRSIKELCDKCSMIICACPPHAATDVAEKVLASCSFKGIYADVNAISPQNVKRIGQFMNEVGVEFVDGGIIGPPAWKPESTWLYLSGHTAGQVAECFTGGPLGVEVIGDEIGTFLGIPVPFFQHACINSWSHFYVVLIEIRFTFMQCYG